MEESNKQLWASVGKLLEATNTKIAIKHRDGTIKELDGADPTQSLDEAFKDIKGHVDE